MHVNLWTFGLKYDPGMTWDHIKNSYEYHIDARKLPNPHKIMALRPLTGQDKEVIDYLNDNNEAQEILSAINEKLFRFLNECDKVHIDIGIFCTGGRHRSVYLAENIKERLINQGVFVVLKHSDIEKGNKEEN